LFRTSPFLDLIGPLFYRKEGDGFVVGLRVLPKHANAYLTVDEGRIVRASAVYARGRGSLTAESSADG
jgi:hypothetical protein